MQMQQDGAPARRGAAGAAHHAAGGRSVSAAAAGPERIKPASIAIGQGAAGPTVSFCDFVHGGAEAPNAGVCRCGAPAAPRGAFGGGPGALESPLPPGPDAPGPAPDAPGGRTRCEDLL